MKVVYLDVFFMFFSFRYLFYTRSHGIHKKEYKTKNRHILTLSDLSIPLKHSGRHMAPSR